MNIVYKADRDKEAIMRAGVAFALLALLIASGYCEANVNLVILEAEIPYLTARNQ